MLKDCWRDTRLCQTPMSWHHDALAGGVSPGQKGFPRTPPLSFNLYLHSPTPRTLCLFYKKPAEGHVTTLSSPPLDTSCTSSKHTAPGGRAKGQKPSTVHQHRRCLGAVTARRGHSGLQKEAPVCWLSGLTSTLMGNPRLPTCSGSRHTACCFVSLHSGGVADRQ